MSKNKNQDGFTLVEGLIIILVLAVIGFAGFYVWHNHHKSTTSSVVNTTGQGASPVKKSQVTQPTIKPFALPQGWSWYENSQYGFKVGYPDSWGQPTFTFGSGTQGNNYALSFHPAPVGSATGITALLQFDSDDYVFSGCNDASGCHNVATDNTKANIESTLTAINSGKANSSGPFYVYHDNSSYITMITNPGQGETDVLDGSQIISLPKINVDATYIDYEQLQVSGSCTQGALSPASVQPCVDQSNLNDVSSVLKSVQPL